jgi:nicotinate-nucleotide adenylyltransferase
MKIGVMGGTFDPVHLGHLSVAEEARRQTVLDEIIFMPAGHPYFKDQSAISSAEDRVNMLKLAIADKPYCKISLMEVQRPGPSYAVESVAKMKSQLSPTDEIFFIMGWDSLMTLHLWYEAERLINLCQVVAAPRPGYPKPDVSRLEKGLPGISQRTIVMENPLIDISATEIRERVRRGLPIEDMVPLAVARYVREHKLYARENEQD